MAATARTRRWRRFAGSAVAVAIVGALPAIVAARPQPHDRSASAQQVLAAIMASADRHYSGYAESHGDAAIPDVAELGNLPSLLGDTTKLRVWWNGAGAWRVDQVGPTSENDVYGFAGGSWEWASADRTATEVTAVAPVRLPRPPDLSPDQLGRRLASLASAPSSRVARIGARRYAGRTALGIAITGGATTTVGAVDVWADAATGVPLAVDVIAKGKTAPTIATAFLSFDPSTPDAGTTAFTPPGDSRVQQVDDQALRGVLGRLRPLDAPSSAGGLAATSVLPGQDGVATYADGLAQVAVVSVGFGDAGTLRDALRSAPGAVTGAGGTSSTDGDLTTVTTPLVSIALLDAGRRHLLAAGTVSQRELSSVLSSVRTAPFPQQPFLAQLVTPAAQARPEGDGSASPGSPP